MALNPTPYSERGAGNTNGYAGYIQEVTLPSGNKYELVDAEARNKLDTLSSYTQFLGVTTTDITDGTTSAVIVVDGTTMTAVTGNIVIKNTGSSTAGRIAQEYIYTGSSWQFFGDISANNLGSLAYKNSASGSHTHITAVGVGTSAVTASGSYTPGGGVSLTKTASVITVTSTSTNPGAGNTANYWLYTPRGSISVTVGNNGTKDAVTGITGRSMVTGISAANPTASTVTGSIGYASVTAHNLMLNHIVQATANSISGTTTATVSTGPKVTAQTFTGSVEYVAPVTVTVATAASFTGTAATISVNTGTTKFVNSVTTTTGSVSVTVS